MSAVATVPVLDTRPQSEVDGDGPRPWKWTREEFYRLGDCGFFQGKRVELVDGEVIVMSPIGWRHSLARGLVADLLRQIFSAGFWVSDQSPFLACGHEVEPDVAVIPGDRRALKDHPSTAALLVEVADTSLAYDLGDKASLYAAASIADYWVLDVVNDRLHVFRDPRPDSTQRFGHGYFQQLIKSPSDRIAPLAAVNSPVLVSDLLP